MFSIRNEKRWIRNTLFVTLAAALVIYISAVLYYGNYFLLGSFSQMDNDDVKYVRSAIILLQKGMLTYHDPDAPTVFIMPGISFALAPFIKLFGQFGGMTAFRVFQAVLQVLSLYFVFLIAREAFDSTVGIIACLINAFYVVEITSAGLILTEVIFKFLFLLLILLTIYGLRTHMTGYYIAGGIVWALACLFRPIIALYPAVVLVMWLMYKYTFKQILKYSLITAAVFALIMSPWWIRNYMTFGRFIPLTLSSGNPFLQGAYINYDQTRDYTPYLETPDGDVIRTNDIEMRTGIYRLKTMFKKYPLQYIYWYTIGKSIYMWNYPYYWKQIPGVSMAAMGTYHYAILLFFLLGLVAFAFKKSREGILLLIAILYFNLAYLPFYTSSRYAYPVIPLLIIFSAYGVYQIIERIPEGHVNR